MRKAHGWKPRLEDYLTTVYRLEEAYGLARTSDIAKELGVFPGTVAKVLKRLEEKRLVRRERYRYVKLTEDGRRIAEATIRKHRIAEAFLSRVLGFGLLESHVYAHHLEHLPDEVIERMFVASGMPSSCPHGNRIPGSFGGDESLVGVDSVRPGEACEVRRIAGELTRALEQLDKLGLGVGTRVTVLSRSDREVRLALAGGARVSLPMKVARLLYLRCEGQF